MADTMASPPKRMTRARAAAKTAAADEETKPRTTKAAAAKAKATPASTAASRRKPIAEPEAPEPTKATATRKRAAKADATAPDTITVEVATTAAPSKGSVRTRRGAVAQGKEDAEMVDVEASKPKGRSKTRVAKKDAEGDATTKVSRGRAKKLAASEIPAGDALVDVPRPARTRGAATRPTASTRSRVATTTAAPKAAPKKKVTFKDVPEEDDKENMPVAAETKEKKSAQVPAAGLRAKPIRKPASTRGRKAATRGKARAFVLEAEDAGPLSPKKATQVAKSNSSVSSDDELSGAKTPIRALDKSPVKAPLSVLGSIKKSETARKLDFTASATPKSPVKYGLQPSSVLNMSPARRMPASPFKDSLKESPKRGIVLPVQVSQSPFKLSASPLKASLLQSPVRRPASPEKMVAAWTSPSKSEAVIASPSSKGNDLVMSVEATALLRDAVEEMEVNITTHFRASPERAFKVHKMTDEELLEEPVSPTMTGSPMKGVVMASLALEETEKINTEVAHEESDAEDPFEDPRIVQIPASSPPQPDKVMMLEEESGNAQEDECILSSSPKASAAKAFQFSSMSLWNRGTDEEESEDELQSDTTPLNRFHNATKARLHTTSTPLHVMQNMNTPGTILPQRSQGLGMTPLAAQLSGWLATSPVKNDANAGRKGLFSPATGVVPQNQATSRLSIDSTFKETPPKSTFFDDEMIIREREEGINEFDVEDQENAAHLLEDESNIEFPTHPGFNQAAVVHDYCGDENEAPPIDPLLLVQHVRPVPITVATPMRPEPQIRVVHTVAKVPLKPAAEESPFKIPRKRSRSLSGASSPRKGPSAPGITRSISANSISEATRAVLGPVAGDLVDTFDQPQTPSISSDIDDSVWSIISSPAKSVQQENNSQVLQGAVVYVDVHTTEGADASGIFVDLLTQMGARCVKQWAWNPRASINVSRDSAFDYDAAIEEAREASTPAGKIGITHVVFKDGGKRTLEKVRESKGVVLCIGVGWVLDCERENRWLDESHYGVDTSIVPRGGSRRRKSMEPRALANFNGNLVSSDGHQHKHATPEGTPTKEFLTLVSPKAHESSLASMNAQLHQNVAPETPFKGPEDYPLPDSPSLNSPTTPYYLNKGAQLIQQTCPPKQTRQGLFPSSGRIQDQPDEAVRHRLLLARRKSLQWAPKVNSPLGQMDE